MTDEPTAPVEVGKTGPAHVKSNPVRFRWPVPRGWTIAFAAVLAVLVAAVAVMATAGSSPTKPNAAPTTTTQPGSYPTAPTVIGKSPQKQAPTCPFSGTPPPGGKVPQRPAVAVKVDNYPTARPWSGLNRADVVFEEPVEGFITRFVAVFQCYASSLVGPVRSARAIDLGILDQLSHPLLVHVGAINPVTSILDAGALDNIDLGYNGQLETHPPGRYAPYDTYTSTDAIWNFVKHDTTPPAPIFTYSSSISGGLPGTKIGIDFSPTSNEQWTYNAGTHTYNLAYSGVNAAVEGAGTVSASNVVVETVQVSFGPWTENDLGGLEVQANLVGHGGLRVFRDGQEFGGQWERSSLLMPTRLISGSGHVIPLQPGQTWVELVPTQIPVVVH